MGSARTSHDVFLVLTNQLFLTCILVRWELNHRFQSSRGRVPCELSRDRHQRGIDAL